MTDNSNDIAAWAYYKTREGKEYTHFVQRVEQVPLGTLGTPLFKRRCFPRQQPTAHLLEGEFYRGEQNIPRNKREFAQPLYTRDFHMVEMT